MSGRNDESFSFATEIYGTEMTLPRIGDLVSTIDQLLAFGSAHYYLTTGFAAASFASTLLA
jgi:hypothetical protein